MFRYTVSQNISDPHCLSIQMQPVGLSRASRRDIAVDKQEKK